MTPSSVVVATLGDQPDYLPTDIIRVAARQDKERRIVASPL